MFHTSIADTLHTVPAQADSTQAISKLPALDLISPAPKTLSKITP